MWKTVGSVCDEGDKSVRSNRSRMDADLEPFHESLKRRSNMSPEANRSFCQDYFEKHLNHPANMSAYSNQSEKQLKGHSVEKDDMFMLDNGFMDEEQINLIREERMASVLTSEVNYSH